MRSLARPSFFRAFELLLAQGNPGLTRSAWTYSGIEWERHKQSFSGPKLGATIEIYSLSKAGKSGWNLIVAKEYWWAHRENKPLKASHWAKPLHGAPGVILDWFRDREKSLEKDGHLIPTSGDRVLDRAGDDDVEVSEHDLS